MTRNVTLIESQAADLALSEREATALAVAGKRLASAKQWWGASAPNEDRTVIRCTRTAPNLWSVRVADAVGLISIDDLQLEVRPKIPIDHFLYLLNMSGAFPRLDSKTVRAARGLSLWDLVARWFLSETETLLQRGLLMDYQESKGWLKTIRGRVDALDTVRALSTGRLEAKRNFEEFETDTPMNRTLKEAARLVSGSSSLIWRDRRRAMAIVSSIPNVSRLRLGDLDTLVDRHSRSYASSIALARHIIAGQGRTIESGPDVAWTFLIRTPELIEEGIRAVLKRELAGRRQIVKQGRQIPGSSLTFSPDLLFDGGLATGDVKYKWLGREWKRADLYQAIAFAVAFDTDLAALGGFRATPLFEPRRVVIGNIEVREFGWIANSDVPPEEAASILAGSLDDWLRAREHAALVT
jgi:5-methylcytosine-specific restriction enzyme subunit McrC